MLLAIDIGNSSINMGIFSGVVLLGKLRIPTHPALTIDIYRNKISDFLLKNGAGLPLRGVILSSVVPGIIEVLSAAVEGLSAKEPMILTTSLKTGQDFVVERPEEVGSDRIANVVAAGETFGPTVLVVDFGTATTISAVKDGKYVGGAILPGLRSMSDALHRDTSRLPLVDISSKTVESRIPVVGKNTTMCIISGIICGTAGAVERLIHEMEIEEACRFNVVITGGYSDMVARFLKKEYFRDTDLTLKGLRLIYERNI